MESVLIQKKSSLLFDVFVILLSIITLLFGMFLVSFVTTDEIASYIDIIPMIFSLWIAVKLLHMDALLGEGNVKIFIFLASVLTLVVLVYSSIFVFSPSGYFYKFDDTGIFNEQAWAYDNMRIISEMSYSDIMAGSLEQLKLRKYETIFFYNSLMFRYGGNVISHICIWRAFHSLLSSILITKAAYKYGINNKSNLSVVLFVTMLQPMLIVFFAYNHDGVGNFFIALGVYLIASSQKNNIQNFLLFPIYTMLFYWFRKPYAAIAIFFYLWAVFHSKQRIYYFISFFAVILLLIYIVSTINVVDFVMYDLEVEKNMSAGENTQANRGLLNRIIVTVLGYYPWLNLFYDFGWPYQLFSVFQGCMTTTVLYYLVKTYKRNIKDLLQNQFFWGATFFLGAAMIHPGHTAYVAVSMPLFAMCLKNIKIKRFYTTYGYVVVVVLISGIIYNMFR